MALRAAAMARRPVRIPGSSPCMAWRPFRVASVLACSSSSSSSSRRPVHAPGAHYHSHITWKVLQSICMQTGLDRLNCARQQYHVPGKGLKGADSSHKPGPYRPTCWAARSMGMRPAMAGPALASMSMCTSLKCSSSWPPKKFCNGSKASCQDGKPMCLASIWKMKEGLKALMLMCTSQKASWSWKLCNDREPLSQQVACKQCHT